MPPKDAGKPVRCYIDLEIGDQEENARQELGFKLAQEFLKAVGSQYGWSDNLADLDQEAQEIFTEAFASDPSWASRGDARVAAPDALVRGRLEIDLATAAAPKACENFRCLCTGEKGNGKASGKPLHYAGLRLHRIVAAFVAQGGDTVKNDGSGGDSIYNGAFKDEKGGLALKNDGPGVVAMANSGPHTQRSQFYVTLAAAPQCDGKHVVVGRVSNSEGLALLGRIEELAASADGTPRTEVRIAACGQLE